MSDRASVSTLDSLYSNSMRLSTVYNFYALALLIYACITLIVSLSSGFKSDYPQRFSDAKITWRTIRNWLAGRRTGLPTNCIAYRPPRDLRVVEKATDRLDRKDLSKNMPDNERIGEYQALELTSVVGVKKLNVLVCDRCCTRNPKPSRIVKYCMMLL